MNDEISYQFGLEDGYHKAIQVIEQYIEETHRHVGADVCLPVPADRCNITAALRAVVARINTRKENP